MTTTATQKPVLNLTMPRNDEAERAVLGSILLHPTCYYEVVQVLKNSTPFFDMLRRTMFEFMGELIEKNGTVDVITLADKLKTANLFDQAGGYSGLSSLTNSTMTSSYVEHYARLVREAWAQRSILEIGGKMRTKAAKKEAPEGIIANVVDDLLSLEGAEPVGNPETLFKGYMEWYEKNQKSKSVGIRTGIAEIDRAMPLGIQPDMQLVIAGRPSDGKTALMLSIVQNIAAHGPVLIVSAETKRHRLMQRLHNQVCPWDEYREAAANKDWGRLRLLREKYKDRLERLSKNLYIQDNEKTIEGISFSVQAEVKRHPEIQVVCIDYLQRLDTRERVRTDLERINTILRRIDRLKSDIKRPIILLSQLNRDDVDEKKGPTMRNLKGSGDIEQDADAVWILWNKNSDWESDVEITLRIAKQRDGPRADVPLRFLKAQTLMISPSKGRNDVEEQEEFSEQEERLCGTRPGISGTQKTPAAGTGTYSYCDEEDDGIPF